MTVTRFMPSSSALDQFSALKVATFKLYTRSVSTLLNFYTLLFVAHKTIYKIPEKEVVRLSKLGSSQTKEITKKLFKLKVSCPGEQCEDKLTVTCRPTCKRVKFFAYCDC